MWSKSLEVLNPYEALMETRMDKKYRLFVVMMLLRVVLFPILLPIKLLCKAFVWVYCGD